MKYFKFYETFYDMITAADLTNEETGQIVWGLCFYWFNHYMPPITDNKINAIISLMAAYLELFDEGVTVQCEI